MADLTVSDLLKDTTDRSHKELSLHGMCKCAGLAHRCVVKEGGTESSYDVLFLHAM